MSRAEHVGMAEQQLLHHTVAHVVHVEVPRVLFNVRVEHHLHQHVAQLLLQKVGVAGVDSLGGLVGLL